MSEAREEERAEEMENGASGSDFGVEEGAEHEESNVRRHEQVGLGLDRSAEDQSGEKWSNQEQEKATEEAEDEVDDTRDLGFRRPDEDQITEKQLEVEADAEEEPRDVGLRRPEKEREGDVNEQRDLGFNRSEDEREVTHLSLPPGRVRKIMKLDREITKVHSEALFLVSLSTELFLEFLAERAGEIVLANKKKTVRIDHLLSATRSHPPTADFLLDSLFLPERTLPDKAKKAPNVSMPPPPGSRRIEEFFSKSS